jgi:hypothetical protein
VKNLLTFNYSLFTALFGQVFWLSRPLPAVPSVWTVAIPGKDFYSDLLRIGITAAGPLLSPTGFPIMSFDARIVFSLQKTGEKKQLKKVSITKT